MDKREELGKIYDPGPWDRDLMESFVSIATHGEYTDEDIERTMASHQAAILKRVDMILDALMEPGEGARHCGYKKVLEIEERLEGGGSAQPSLEVWQAILRHIREGGE